MREQTGHRLITSPEFPAAGGLSQTQQCLGKCLLPTGDCCVPHAAWRRTRRRLRLSRSRWSCPGAHGSACAPRQRWCRCWAWKPVFEVQSAIRPYSPLSGAAVVFVRIPVSVVVGVGDEIEGKSRKTRSRKHQRETWQQMMRWLLRRTQRSKNTRMCVWRCVHAREKCAHAVRLVRCSVYSSGARDDA